jgi:uncharacterized protein YkwD
LKLLLQILDVGETYFRPLEGRTLRIGSAADVEVRLLAAGVEAEHARIDPDGSSPEGDERYRLVATSTAAPTRVNGEEVAQWRLSIGDRIEVGAAVLVVGKQVPRPATPSDVLADGAELARASAELRRRRVRGGGSTRGSKARLVGIGLAVLAALALVFALTRGAETLPLRWGELVAMRRHGRVEDGRTLADQLRATWARDDAGRNARIDALVADLDAIDRRLAAGREEIRAEAARRSRVEEIERLRQLRAAGDETVDGIVARLLLSDLDELRYGRTGIAADAAGPGGLPEGLPEPVEDRPPPTVPAVGPEPGVADPAAEGPSPEAAAFVAEQLRAIDELRSAGRYTEALETMRFALAATEAAVAAPLQEARIRLGAEVDRAMRAVVDRAREIARSGAPADVERAIALLSDEGARFPADGEFGKIALEQRELEDYRVELERRARLAVEAPSPSAPALGELRDQLAAVRQLERDGHFAGAAVELGRAADAVRGSDPLYAANLDGRRHDLELLAELAEHLRAELRAGRPLEVELAELGPASLALVDGELRAAGEALQWSAVLPRSLEAALRPAGVGPEVLLGGAVHAYRAADREFAEQLLARALRRDAGLQGRIDGLIGRGRGEVVADGGFRLVDGQFVAARQLETLARARELEKVLARVVRQPAERRDAALDEILAKGPQELDALVLALREVGQRTASRIARDAFRRHWEKVAQVREALDAARAHAKELIFDEVRYFYPYKPPAVSPEKASEYAKVQAEVDARVAAVRALWEAEGASKRAPPRLLDELADLDWCVGVLAGFGERLPGVEDEVAWARGLPADAPLELRSFCWDRREAEDRAHWARIEAYNQRRAADLTRAEIAQVEITNGYRRMFGHRPLAVNRKLLVAARGHAEEMGRLGYFSHYSPTPGRKSPFERMKLAGYTKGASENIANHPSAQSAHEGWTHSSGHHRNLLSPSHDEFAVGNDGRIWVQNFGRGEDFRSDADWVGGG